MDCIGKLYLQNSEKPSGLSRKVNLNPQSANRDSPCFSRNALDNPMFIDLEGSFLKSTEAQIFKILYVSVDNQYASRWTRWTMNAKLRNNS
jgi:hypothetical protein